MSRIYGGVEESELQNLIRETMQELLGQRDDAMHALSERVGAVDERTRQGVAGVSERLEALAKQVQGKADTSLLDSTVVGLEQTMQRKFEGVEWRSSAADERINTLTQRLAQLGRDIDRGDDESRETSERLDDLSRRFQHKADSAYVDVRVGELRSQLQRKADADALEQGSSELRQALGECRQLLAQKDEQLGMMMQQLAGKVEGATFNTVMEDLQEMSKVCNEGVMNTAQELTKLYTTVQRYEEMGIEERFRELTQLMHQERKRVSEDRIAVLERRVNDFRGDQLQISCLDQTIEGPTALVQQKASIVQASNLSPRGKHLDAMSPKALTNGPWRTSSSYAPPAGAPTAPEPVVPLQSVRAVDEAAAGGSAVLPRSSPPRTSRQSAAAEAPPLLRTSQLQQAQSPQPQFVRSSSAPGLRRMSSTPAAPTNVTAQLGVTSTVMTPLQVSGFASPASVSSSVSQSPGAPGAANAGNHALLQMALPWTTPGGHAGLADGKGVGRGGAAAPMAGLRPLAMLPPGGSGGCAGRGTRR